MAKNNPTLEITLCAMKLIAKFGELPKLLQVRWNWATYGWNFSICACLFYFIFARASNQMQLKLRWHLQWFYFHIP